MQNATMAPPTTAHGTSITTPRIDDRPDQAAAVLRVEGPAGDLARLVGEAFHVTAEAIARSGATIVGPPFTRYIDFGERILADVGFPFVGELREDPRVRRIVLPGGRRVSATYVGPYDGIAAAWETVATWMQDNGHAVTGLAWESYLTGPDDPGMPVTEIVWPID